MAFSKIKKPSSLKEAICLFVSTIFCLIYSYPLHSEIRCNHIIVVEIDERNMVDWCGPTLVLSAFTENESLRRELLLRSAVDRLHLGQQKTTVVDWTQPHQGNLFEFLYRRRALMV